MVFRLSVIATVFRTVHRILRLVMGTLEIVIGAVLLLISLVTIIICMMQEQKPQNATAALTGASNDSFYDKNRGRTKEARLH